MKYHILGNGYMGQRFRESLEGSVLSSARINSVNDARSEINEHRPDVVINAIGKCGNPNVDWCQNHVSDTMWNNIEVPLLIAQACKRKKVKMVHLGSGCIYEGRKNGTGFSEEDHPNFGWSVYSVSKQFVEKKLKGFPDVLQLRIRMPLDCIVHPRNLITKLLGYDRILDEPNSVSYVPDVIRAARWLVEKDASGVYNVVNGGELRHPELLDTYQKLSGRQLSYRVINHKELDDMTAAKRSNCILSNEKLISTGFIIPDIKVAMPAAVALYVDHERQLETSR